MHQVLGYGQREIARILNISRKTVKSYLVKMQENGLVYEDIKNMGYKDLIGLLGTKDDQSIIKYEKLASRFSYMLKESKKVGVTLELLWEEYLLEEPDGYKYSRFCYHFREWKKSQKATMHMEHKAGDKMYIDFAGKKLKLTDAETGKIKNVEVFIAVLGASQLTYVEAVADQKKHSWLSANVNALEYFGGVPRAIVPDNLKSGVTKSSQYEPEINPDYLDFAQHYGTTIIPARAYKPKDKALVEGAVNIVYKWIYAKLRNNIYYSLEELNRDILKELENYNLKKKQKEGLSRRELFDDIEKEALQPLPIERYSLKEFYKLKVNLNYHIYLSKDKHYYSVPYQYIDKQVDVVCCDSSIEIFYDNKRIAFHKRVLGVNKYTTNQDHMPLRHKWTAGLNDKKIKNLALEHGEFVLKIIESILQEKAHKDKKLKQCLGIIKLSQWYSNESLNNACKRALHFKQKNYSFVKNTLVNKLENKEIDESTQVLPKHENIRGKAYYNISNKGEKSWDIKQQ